MNTARNTAEILDLDAFRKQRAEMQASDSTPSMPLLVWVPVWVMIPQQMITIH